MLTAAVITISDKGHRGERIDTSGPAICARLEKEGWSIKYKSLVPDDIAAIKTELIHCSDELDISLVLTTGGTGFSARDVTPEATLEVIERPTPGFPEVMRAESVKITPAGMLSRAQAGICWNSIIINLPGSEKAAAECLEAVLPAIKHAVEMLRGVSLGTKHNH